MGEPIKTRNGKLAGRCKHDARLGRMVQVKKWSEEIYSFELCRKEILFTVMKRNRERRRTKRTETKRMHIAVRAYDTGHGESKARSKW